MNQQELEARKHHFICNKINSIQFISFKLKVLQNFPGAFPIPFFKRIRLEYTGLMSVSALTSIYILTLCSASLNFFFFNFLCDRLDKFLPFDFPLLIHIALSGFMAFFIALSLRDGAFDTIKNHYQYIQQKVNSLTFWNYFRLTFRHHSKKVYMFIAFSVFSGSLFIFEIIEVNQVTKSQTATQIERLEKRLFTINENEKRDINPLIESMNRLITVVQPV